MSLNANGALKALCLISQAWGQRQRHVHTHAQTCRKHPYYVTKSHMLPWERGRSGLAGRERKTRQSEGKYQINKEAAGSSVGLPTAPSAFWKHILPQTHTHLTGATAVHARSKHTSPYVHAHVTVAKSVHGSRPPETPVWRKIQEK